MSIRIGKCPYCAEQMKPIMVERNIIRRNKYQCTKCLQKIVECASWGCHTYVAVNIMNRYCSFCSETGTYFDNTDYSNHSSSNRESSFVPREHHTTASVVAATVATTSDILGCTNDNIEKKICGLDASNDCDEAISSDAVEASISCDSGDDVGGDFD